MNEKKLVQNILLENNINWDVKDFKEYVNPKCKSAKSLFDKLCRLYDNNKVYYSISSSKIDDLLRMTIIVEYKDAVLTIKKLKKQFLDLSGYLQIEDAGYRGVHLNLKIDGIPCEIQLAPKIVVMTIDYLHTLYEKWRNHKPVNNQEKLEEEKDFLIRNKIYGQIYNIAKFSIYKDDIQDELNIINKNKQESTQLVDKDLKALFDTNLLTDGILDKNKLEKISIQISNKLKSTQEKFINLVKSCVSSN